MLLEDRSLIFEERSEERSLKKRLSTRSESLNRK